MSESEGIDKVFEHCCIAMIISITVVGLIFLMVISTCVAHIIIENTSVKIDKMKMYEYDELERKYDFLESKYILLIDDYNLLLEEHSDLKTHTSNVHTELCNAGITRFCELTIMRVTAYDENMQSCKPLYDGEFCKTIDNHATTTTIYKYEVGHIQIDEDDYQH